ncbi:MAG: type II secretion system GspH family protein [Candidatus Pacebacteria bacterium]|nr:type II secretion system GspH family protein [Candidatus Paceibacterota bacterium]
MYTQKQKRGFTLIELLVVIAIIGILSSIVLASLNTARQKSRDARRIADIKQIQLAMQLYYDASSTYPTALSNLAPLYLPKVPTDPIGQAAYPYDQLASGASYHLGANLEDGSNQALNSDLDTASDTGNIDSGSDTDGNGCQASVASRFCYDVGP